MELLVQLIHEKALLPSYARAGDAGLDISSVEALDIAPGEAKLVHTGLKIELPPNTEAQIRPRSGLALKHGITVLNSPGTIDEGYRGEIGVILINHGREIFRVSEGMRIAQMVIKPTLTVQMVAVNQVSDSERGKGGFGSTGYDSKKSN